MGTGDSGRIRVPGCGSAEYDSFDVNGCNDCFCPIGGGYLGPDFQGDAEGNLPSGFDRAYREMPCYVARSILFPKHANTV